MSKYILIADMHLRYDLPKSRKDDFNETQIKKLQWLSDLKKELNAIILNAGDIFHKPRPDYANELLSKIVLPYFPNMFGVVGNHDLLYHKIENLDNSIIGILLKTSKYNFVNNDYFYDDSPDVICGFNFGEEIEPPFNKGRKNIAIYHGYVSKESGFISGKVAIDLLKEFPEYNLILTGDNHETFTEEYQGRYLVNPGCFTRQTADKINHKPCVFIYDSELHTIEQRFIPIEHDVFNLEHLEIQKEKDQRLNSFIETVNGTYEIGGSFKINMENYMLSNETEKAVEDMIYTFMEVTA